MTFWPLTNSDFPTDQTFHQFHDLYTELVLHRIMSGVHGAYATGVASQQGTLTPPDNWFRPTFGDLLMLQLLRPNSSNLPCLYSTFHLEYPLVLSRFCFPEDGANATLQHARQINSRHTDHTFVIGIYFISLWPSCFCVRWILPSSLLVVVSSLNMYVFIIIIIMRLWMFGKVR